MLAIERLRGAIGRGADPSGRATTEVATFLEVDGVAGALQATSDACSDRRPFGRGTVGVPFQRHDLTATITAVGRDEHLGLAVLDSTRPAASAC